MTAGRLTRNTVESNNPFLGFPCENQCLTLETDLTFWEKPPG